MLVALRESPCMRWQTSGQQRPGLCPVGESHKALSARLVQVTPAHTDPHHNLLAQVRGRKYVRLYTPSDLAHLYPFPSGLTTNTSQVCAGPLPGLSMHISQALALPAALLC